MTKIIRNFLVLFISVGISVTFIFPAKAEEIVTFDYIPLSAEAFMSANAPGPNQTIWYISSEIGKITLDGTVTKIPYPQDMLTAFAITQGSDGRMWLPLVNNSWGGSHNLAAVNSDGSISQYELPMGTINDNSPFVFLTQGSGTNLWLLSGNRIGKFDIDTHQYLVLIPWLQNQTLTALLYGDDGFVWYGGYRFVSDKMFTFIGRFSESGDQKQEFTISESSNYSFSGLISGLTNGPDGNVWFSDSETDRIGKITSSGEITSYKIGRGTETEESCRVPTVVSGPDGNLWSVCNSFPSISQALVRISTTGVITRFDGPTFVKPFKGPDGNLYALETNYLIKFNIPGSSTPTPTPTPTPTVKPIPNECADLLFMGARGSGNKGPGTPGWIPSGSDPFGFGGVVNYVYKQFNEKLSDQLNIVPISVNYPAMEVMPGITDLFDFDLYNNWKDTAVFAPDKYFNGLYGGTNFTTQKLKQRAEKCPNEQIVLAGYSQGAMVMHRALNQLSTNTPSNNSILNRITAALLIADGDRVANEKAINFGTMRKQTNGIGLSYPSQSGSVNKKFSSTVDSKKKVLQVCNRYDFVCDYPALLIDLPVHLRYVGNPNFEEAVNVAINLVGSRPVPGTFNLIATQGMPFNYQLTAKIDSDYTLEWGLVPPSTLPGGLSMNRSGLITGTPKVTPTGTTLVRVRSSILGINGDWIPAILKWN